MRLLIDIGNSRIKWALQTSERISSQQTIAHRGLTAQQIIKEVLQPYLAVEAVFISNVAGDAIAAILRQAIIDHWGLEPVFVSAVAECTVRGRVLRNGYIQPAQLGVDRWLAMMAARSLTANATLVVSMGTAMTLDAINAEGQHLGGLIIPGLDIMRQSLLQQTSDLAARFRQVKTAEVVPNLLADNTLDGIQVGTLRAASSVIASLYTQLQQRDNTKILLTGGAADEIQKVIQVESEVIPNLVLQGLSLCHTGMGQS